jgi:hypothetical protein
MTQCSIGAPYGSEGAYKIINLLVQDQSGPFTITFPRGKRINDYIIITFKPDGFNSQDVYSEIQKYYEFSSSGLCPLILCIFENDKSKEMSLTNFLSKYNRAPIPPTTCIIMEKYNCSRDVFKFFDGMGGFDSRRFFTELKDFLTRLVQFGQYNVDMKIENICYERGRGFIMIDLDNKFIKPVSDNAPLFVTYMLFQVFMKMRIYNRILNGRSIDFNDTGITEQEYRDMMQFILDRHNTLREEYSELYMLCYYSGLKVRDGIRQFDRYTSFKKTEKKDEKNPEVIGGEDPPPVEQLLERMTKLKKLCETILSLYFLPEQNTAHLTYNLNFLNRQLETLKSQMESFAQIVRNSKNYIQNYRQRWEKYLSEDEKLLPFEQVDDLVQKRLMDAYGLQIKCQRVGKCALAVAAAAYTLKKLVSGGKTRKRKRTKRR